MLMQDLKNNVLPVQSIAPAVRTNGTVNGTGVDLFDYGSAAILFEAGAWTDGTHTPSVEESDDNSTFTAVSAGNLHGSFTALSGSGQQNAVQWVGYKGSKRYLRAKLVTGSATTGALSAMTIVKGHPRNAPAA